MSDMRGTISAPLGAFDDIYSDEQREAFTRAYVPYKVTGAMVSALAASGQLKAPDGTLLEPFQVSADTVRSYGNRYKAKVAGKVKSSLAELEPRDATEAYRRRLINAADALLADYEKQLKREPHKAEPARLSAIARVAREIAALPGPDDPRPRKPGSMEGGKQTEGRTTSGLAGSILHAARGGTAQDTPPQHTQEGESAHTAPEDDDAHAAAQRLVAQSLQGGRVSVQQSPAPSLT